jgi:hypothetical protein
MTEDRMKMRTVKIVLAALVCVGMTADASASVNRSLRFNDERGNIAVNVGAVCPLSGGPQCSEECLSYGPPCKTEHDGW